MSTNFPYPIDWDVVLYAVYQASGQTLSVPTPFAWNPPSVPLASNIDHTLLAPDATPSDISRLAADASEWKTAAVCVNPGFVAHAAQALTGTSVKVATVAGFPLGSSTPQATAFEAREAVAAGATEIDMVMSIGHAKAGEWAYVYDHIRTVREAVPAPSILKVILETCLLTDNQKTIAALLAVAAGTDFVKTSTGFSKGGATVHDVSLLRQVVGPGIGVKASAGIRSYHDAFALLQAGANRLGTSRTGNLIKGAAQ